jgi:integrase
MRTWGSDELRRFLEGVSDDRLVAAWVLAATTGLRTGEVLGLRWRDVSLERARLHVRRALVLVDDEPRWSEPKTASGKGSVPLAPETVAALRRHRAAQAEERLLLGFRSGGG